MKNVMKNRAYIVGIVASLALVACAPVVQAGFFDTETSVDNTITAGTLDLVLSDIVPVAGVDVGKDESATGSVTVTNNGSIAADMRATVTSVSGNADLCGAVTIEAHKGSTVYGPMALSVFDVDAGAMAGGDVDSWSFEVAIPDTAPDAASEQTCVFDIQFTAQQSGLSSGGFSDVEDFSGNSIASGDWVAPEVPTILGFKNPTLSCGAVTNIHSTTVDWTDSVDSGSGLDKYEYFIDYPKTDGSRGQWTTYPTSSQYSGSLNEGIHYIKVRAKDVAGNYSEWSNECSITADWTVPISTMTSPTDGETYTGIPISITGNTQDTYSVASVKLSYAEYTGSACGATYTQIPAGELNIAQNPIQNTGGSNPFVWNVDWTPSATGSYCIKAQGTDLAGNEESSFVVENVTYQEAAGAAPVISNIQLVPGDGMSAILATVTWNTDIPATSNVLFGHYSVSATGNTTGDLAVPYEYTSPIPEDAKADHISHSVDLIPAGSIDSPMYFRVVSKNANNQETISEEQAFLIDFSTGNITFLPAGSFAYSSTPAATTGFTPNVGDIVLNEIMPHPEGAQDNHITDAACLNDGECGEWVELYNTTDADIDVNGWYIYDHNDDGSSNHRWAINIGRSDNNGNLTDSGETTVPAHGFLVVYKNGGGMSLNDTGSEAVVLRDNSGTLMDQHSFDDSDFYEGKSIARFPDGVGVWIDPEGTPGEENELSNDELLVLRGQTFEMCFAGGDTLEDDTPGTMCDPIFLEYIGMIDDVDSDELARDEYLPVETDGAEEEILAQIAESVEVVENVESIEDEETEEEGEESNEIEDVVDVEVVENVQNEETEEENVEVIESDEIESVVDVESVQNDEGVENEETGGDEDVESEGAEEENIESVESNEEKILKQVQDDSQGDAEDVIGVESVQNVEGEGVEEGEENIEEESVANDDEVEEAEETDEDEDASDVEDVDADEEEDEDEDQENEETDSEGVEEEELSTTEQQS
jgi:hypothetical protein